eukprot:m.564504 g.564504  ORF g.564504 m.564504 type:complete len:75 (+) comp57814_c0_seq66:1105-1329(+)
MTLTQALFIPGVLWFAVCLFFVKLISYTFLNWLPYYVENTSIQGRYLSESDAAALSSLVFPVVVLYFFRSLAFG